MTHNPEPIDDDLEAVLAGMSRTAKEKQHESPSYRAMDNATSINQVVRRVRDGHTNIALDAFDVLVDKFGLPDTHELYAYLYELPHRFKTAEAAFRAETYVGCVDRAAAQCTEDIKVAAGVVKRPLGSISPRASKAALSANVDEITAQEILNVSDQADDGHRIQRLSVDTREIARRVGEKFPGLSDEKLRATVRLILTTAAEITHEKDGVDVA